MFDKTKNTTENAIKRLMTPSLEYSLNSSVLKFRLVPIGHYFFKNTVPGTKYGNFTNLNFNTLELSEYSNEGVINLLIAFSVVFFVLSNICFYKYFKLSS